ncbi:MAG: imidazolonepropionase, partial [Pseudomonadota bacterium]
MADWDLLLTDARIATMCGDSYGVIEEAASIAFQDGHIAWVGPMSAQPTAAAIKQKSVADRWITPSLIDCHTHLVFAGDRAAEFEQRLRGASYEDIARAGGGIMSTVQATRAASVEELFDLALPRALALAAEGVTTIEIKSGYGLTVADELKMLDAARRIGEATPLTIRTTLLAAHTVPPEFKNDADSYIRLICDELLPAVAERGLADAVDAYCESIAFDTDQVGRLFEKATALGLPVKLHADQLSDCGGAVLAAEHGALSADHLEYTSAEGVAALAAAGTVAVLLPGAFYVLRETRLPPIELLRDHG